MLYPEHSRMMATKKRTDQRGETPPSLTIPRIQLMTVGENHTATRTNCSDHLTMPT